MNEEEAVSIDVTQFYIRLFREGEEIGCFFDLNRFTEIFGKEAAEAYQRYGEIIAHKSEKRNRQEFVRLEKQIQDAIGIDPRKILDSREETTRRRDI